MKKLVLCAFLLGGSSAFAVGDAGCGLGSVIITKNSKLMQLFAVTTNGTFGSQTFGITSGTSNCSARGFVMNEKQIQYFVEVNESDLKREMAQGHGEKLATLAALHGCSNEAAVESFGARTQSSYQEIVPSAKTSAVDVVHNLKALSMENACKGA